MFVSEVCLTFQTLEQAMNLPETAKIVAVAEKADHLMGVVKVRIVSSTPPPEDYSLPHLSMLGEVFRHPEKYKAGPNTGKGMTRAEAAARSQIESGSGGEAEVDVIKAR